MSRPEITVTIRNDLTGTRRTFVLPTTVEEAMENCVALQQAFRFVDRFDCFEQFGPSGGPEAYAENPLAVVIRKTADSINIRWWAPGDVKEALKEFHKVTEGGAFA